jgi:transcriptional regulator with XRE-family HTH domain
VPTDPLIVSQWIRRNNLRRIKPVNQIELADFLRKRREALQPEDVGLHRGPRRRATGLRREEVANLIGMSTDYYSRLERGDSPKPSDQMTAAIARGLRLSFADRDHLFLLVGHTNLHNAVRNDHVSPGLMRILDRLEDTPAQIMGGTGETIVQNRLARAMYGDQTKFTGLSRAIVFRWFTDPTCRNIYVEDDHPLHGRYFTAALRSAVARQGPRSFAANVADELTNISDEFRSIWAEHEIGVKPIEPKRIQHREVGRMDLHCQVLLDPDQTHTLLVFTATPGSQSTENLRLLSVVADH